ncbi:hypothetical protein [Luteolibacter sp. Populi]|uniref:hypothetical protein n=1 Tax=Luteolibacter sp. Populi TaxID=3230487 RepID=UPI0034669F81
MTKTLALALLAAAIIALLLFKPSSDDPENPGTTSRSGSPGSATSSVSIDQQAGTAGAKRGTRKTILDLLPPGARIEAEEDNGTSAKGKVRITFADGTELRGDRVSAAADKRGITIEDNVVIWTGDRKTCMVKKESPLKFEFDGDSIKLISAQSGMAFQNFAESQTPEQMVAVAATMLRLNGNTTAQP